MKRNQPLERVSVSIVTDRATGRFRRICIDAVKGTSGLRFYNAPGVLRCRRIVIDEVLYIPNRRDRSEASVAMFLIESGDTYVAISVLPEPFEYQLGDYVLALWNRHDPALRR
ncbi:hypothetical protein GCM10023068_39780 [Leifsonia shinshuensis]